ncbi:MAG: hypothetical protein E2O29_01655 [Deltaproteobacteria bacterium]|nr:MAG: hypothetical protein E2O29_01655 [Deltaproteobacteria bacterium]
MKKKKVKEWEITYRIPEEEHDEIWLAFTKKEAEELFWETPGTDPTSIITSIKELRNHGGMT